MKIQYKIVILFLILVLLFLAFGRALLKDKTYQPTEMVGKKVPNIILNDFNNKNKKISLVNLTNNNLVVINIWSSWCIPCKEENYFLLKIKKNSKINILGINYKDQHTNALKFLKDFGNPFNLIASDTLGEASIQLGAYGVPETFVVKNGIIVAKFLGSINEEITDAILNLSK